MVYRIPAGTKQNPYTADVFPPVISTSFFGNSEKASEGWYFPQEHFPDATHPCADYAVKGEGLPKEIPEPMIAYATTAVSACAPWFTACSPPVGSHRALGPPDRKEASARRRSYPLAVQRSRKVLPRVGSPGLKVERHAVPLC